VFSGYLPGKSPENQKEKEVVVVIGGIYCEKLRKNKKLVLPKDAPER